MTTTDLFVCLVAFVTPYCGMLRFRAPFNLAIETDRDPLSVLLCRLVRPMVFLSGLLLSGAVLAHRHHAPGIALALFVCALPLLALLLVPGFIALQQEYGVGARR